MRNSIIWQNSRWPLVVKIAPHWHSVGGVDRARADSYQEADILPLSPVRVNRGRCVLLRNGSSVRKRRIYERSAHDVTAFQAPQTTALCSRKKKKKKREHIGVCPCGSRAVLEKHLALFFCLRPEFCTGNKRRKAGAVFYGVPGVTERVKRALMIGSCG